MFKSLFIGVHVPSQKSEQFFCIYMLGVSILPLSTTFLLDYGTIPTVWYFFWNYSDSGIFWNCSDSVVFFLELPTVWYFWNYSDSVVFFWNYSDSVVFLELFRQWYFFHFPFYSYLKQSNNDVLSKRGSFFSFSYL